jgi:phosphatidylglycerophosphatase A
VALTISMQIDPDIIDATPSSKSGAGSSGNTGSGRFGSRMSGAALNKPAKPPRATARFMLSHPLHILSLGFGSGLAPFAPGTFGTLFAWFSFAALQPYLSTTAWAILIIGGLITGIGFTGFTARKMGTGDPGAVVWDEIIAFWAILLMVTPASFGAQVWAFVLFRFFDSVKPPPVGYFDRNFKGGYGIMIDDLAAAFMTLLVIAVFHA